MPIISPGFYDDGIIFAPFEFKVIEFVFCFFEADGLINLLEVFNELFLIFACHVFYRIADLMHDTALNRRFGKNTQDGIRKARQVIRTGYQDIFYASRLKIGKYRKPKVGSLTFRYVHSKQIFVTVAVNTQHIVNGTCYGTVLFIHYLVMNGIHPYDGINRIQRAAAPRLKLREHPVGYGADRIG